MKINRNSKPTLFAALALAALTTATTSQAGTMIPIDITMSGAIVRSADTLELRNVKVPGYGNYKMNLVWDPELLNFKVKTVEIDSLPQFAVLPTPVKITSDPSQPNYDTMCATGFGGAYRLGTWEEVKAAVGSSTDNLNSLVNTLSLTPSSRMVVKYGGNERNPGSRLMYFITYQYLLNTNYWPLLDSALSDLRIFGQYTTDTGQLLCTKGSATAPF